MLGPIGNNPDPLLSQLRRNWREQNEVLLRLSTGRRINSGRDDPAGLIAATDLEAAIAALDAESRALERNDSRAQITDGQVAQISGMMNDLRGLVVASANSGALSHEELAANQMQIDNIAASVRRFADDALASLDGLGLPEETRTQLAEQLQQATAAVSSLASGGANALAGGDFEAMQAALDEAATAFAQVRGAIGAHQKYTLEAQHNTLAVQRENLVAAHSQIVDADYAEEASNLTRSQILTAANLRVLQIANYNAGLVLNLLS